ncbi:MAG: translation initiation factor IF-3 [Clostridia bacterium]
MKPDKSKDTQINEQIRDREVRLIGSDGSQLGIMSSRDAYNLAVEQGLDLVKISPTAVPPVCKIIDYGKFLFDQKKREKEDGKKQSFIELKEIGLSATIDVGDMKTKATQTIKFLQKGYKVKVGLRLKGRQMQHTDIAFKVVEEFLTMLEDLHKVDKAAKLEGRTISVYISPAAAK